MPENALKIKRLTETAVVPTRGSADAAGWDLYADLNTDLSLEIAPASSYVVPTGIAMEIPKGCFGALYARSGLATKQGLRPANCVGVIDSDYRGEIKVVLHNDSTVVQHIKDHDRIAQIVIQPYIEINEMTVVNDLDETGRGAGGFGSTGA